MAQDASTETTETRKSSTQADLRALASKTMTVAAAVIRIVSVVFAAVLVIHVVLSVTAANPQNGITIFFQDLANNLTLGVGNLFLTGTPTLDIILNYGIAAVLWIAIGLLLSRLLNALAPS